ncbi:MAG: antitoxin family protein [Thermoguttaceae bacterium]
MSQIILATVENGFLKPDREIGLAPGTKVRLTIEPYSDAVIQTAQSCAALDELCEQLPVDSHGDRLTRDQLHDRR